MVRRRLFLLVLLGLVAGVAGLATASAQPARFLSTIDDLPLMPGLTEEPGAGVVFDGPTGRIVDALATGGVSGAQVMEFYASALPQLGWSPGAAGSYRRDAEILTIQAAPAAAGAAVIEVRFRLRPAKP